METNPNDQIQPGLSSASVKNKSVQIGLLVKRWRTSGKTKKVFCEENNLNYNTFISWLNKSKKRKAIAAALLESENNLNKIHNFKHINKLQEAIKNYLSKKPL